MRDDELAALERVHRQEPPDANLVRLVRSLVRAGRTQEGWREVLAEVRASRPLAGALLDAFGAPFMLVPFPLPTPACRYLGARLAKPIVVGRKTFQDRQLADVCLETPLFARRHFSVSYEGGGRFVVEDLQSHCGTFVHERLRDDRWGSGTRAQRLVVGEGACLGISHTGVEIALGWGDEPVPEPDLDALARVGGS